MGKDTATVHSFLREHVDSTEPPNATSDDEDATLLGRIETAFLTMSRQQRPAPPRLPAALLGHPGGWLSPLDVRTDLQARLKIQQGLHVDGDHVVQRVWGHIAEQARDERGDWFTVAAGMAMPALKAEVPTHAQARVRELIHSDLVARLVEVLSGAEEEPFDITAPYLFHRLIDRVRYAALRSRRRLSAPSRERLDLGEDEPELAPDPERLRWPRIELGDPLIILANLVQAGQISRLDAALLARTSVCGWSRAEAFTDVRTTLPAEVGNLTDDALRGRLNRARGHLATVLGYQPDPRAPTARIPANDSAGLSSPHATVAAAGAHTDQLTPG